MLKPAYKTSEFWFTLVSFVISGLFIMGVITEPDTKDELISVISHAVESIILISGQFIVLSRYLHKRNQQKIEYEKTQQKEAEIVAEELAGYIGVDKNHSVININEASIGDLVQLPHIGPATAKRIVDYRSMHGSFVNKEQLKTIKGIGQSTLEDIKPYIVLS